MSLSKMAEVLEWLQFKTVRIRRDTWKERTDTEVGEDGMDAGERDMSSEFLFGDPRDAGEEVWKKMRERTGDKGGDVLTGEGRRLLGSRVGHRWWWWFGDGVEANKGEG